MPAPFRFDRRFPFDASPDELWATFHRTDRYVEWWPWLREFDGALLAQGSVARCVIQAPLPYSLRFTITVDEIVPGCRIETQVHGDLEGPAALDVEPGADGGSVARLRWELVLRDRLLRPVAAFARPAMVWAHDRVIEVGLRDFERKALDGHGPSTR